MTTESLSVTIDGELLTVEIGTVAAPAGGGGSGDVVGPASATDSRIAEFDGTTGKLIKQSSYTIATLLAAAWARASHTGTQLAATISDFASAAIAAVTWSTITGKPSTFDPSAHKTSHATGGGDALTASDIGAATAGHDHTGVYQPLATVLTNTTASFTTADETKLDAIEALADVTDAGNVGAAIDGATAKTTPVDADTVALIDSAAGNVLKKLSWANIKATAKTYFDTLYQAASATLTTWAGITPGTGVGTALGTNVGSAGAVVVNGGALGTPSSATLTNATGLPPAGITQSGATSNQVLTWNGSAWAPATPSAGSPAGSSGQMQYNNASAFGAANLWRESADIIALRNSTTAQTFYVYDTYTDASNYGRLAINTSLTGDWVQVAAETAGTAGDNYGIALTPSGTGAISAQVPDNGTGGGNARGARAVDWSTLRGYATAVASGSSSVVSGGYTNTASGAQAFVGAGHDNAASGLEAVVVGGSGGTASGANSTVGGGINNVASQSSATVAGGSTNTASGIQSAVGGGISNTASGTSSWVPGGRNATTRGLWGAYAYSSGQRSALGDAQVIGQPVRRTTTDATPVSLATDGTPAATTVMVLPASSTLMVTAIVAARDSSGNSAGWIAQALFKRDGSNNTSRLGAATVTPIGTPDTAINTATIDLVANDTLESAQIEVTGVAATTIYWAGELKCVQVL